MLYLFESIPISIGMRLILPDIPNHLLTLVTTLRATLRDPGFWARHRVRPADFTRDCCLTFPVLVLFVLQKTSKSIHRHLHEFLTALTHGDDLVLLTSGAVTHARAKLQASAFRELNREGVLATAYGPEHPIHRWRGHRLLGVDSSLLRLPDHPQLGQVFGWKTAANQTGATGTRYPEARLSVLYDLLNHLGLDASVAPSTCGEVALASQQLAHVQSEDVLLNDRGFSGYGYFALVRQRGAHFIGRCSTASFLATQELFRQNRAGRSRVVWLHARADQHAECRRLGLPLKLQVRFLSVRLATGELEVLATSLLDETRYPTAEFRTVYHWRWGHETYYLMLKGRLELENFSGRTVAAVHQDIQAAVLLANLESLLSAPGAAALHAHHTAPAQPLQINRATAYHAVKFQVLALLYGELPVREVLQQLTKLLVGSPVPARPDRPAPPRRPPSLHRSYHYQRRVKKVVF